MQTTVVNFTCKPGKSLSESIEEDMALLRDLVDSGDFFALSIPDGRIAYVETEGAPAELLLMALTPEQLLQAQQQQTRRIIQRVN